MLVGQYCQLRLKLFCFKERDERSLPLCTDAFQKKKTIILCKLSVQNI